MSWAGAPGDLGAEIRGGAERGESPLPGAAPRGPRRGTRCVVPGKAPSPGDVLLEVNGTPVSGSPTGHPGCHSPLPRAHPSQDCEARYAGPVFRCGVGSPGWVSESGAAPPHRLSSRVTLEPPGCAGLPCHWGGVAVLIPILRVGKLSLAWAGCSASCHRIATRSWVSLVRSSISRRSF